MDEHFQTICKIEKYIEECLDISIFKNGSFCLLYQNCIDYYSKHYKYLYTISLDYNPTHLLTLTINSELYVIIRNNKSIYLYLLKGEFLYKTQIHLMNDITYWTKTKDNQIIICSKNKISFYKIYNNYILKTQNDVKIEEETYIENSLYFKNKKKDSSVGEIENEKNDNFPNLSIVKIIESDDDYIIIIKQEIGEKKDYLGDTSDCPCCAYCLYEQTNVKLLSLVKLSKKEKKIKIIYEIELKNKYKYYKPYIFYEESKINSREYYDKSICDSVGFLRNKFLFYIPQTKDVKIIDINSPFGPKYESILYNSGEIIERYKIIFISEKCFFRFKYEYDKYDGNINYIDFSFIYNNNEDNIGMYNVNVPFIKKLNSLLFVSEEFYLTIFKEL